MGTEQLSANDVALDFAGSVPDPLDPGVPPEHFQWQLVHQPHAPQDLDRLIRHPLRHLRAEELGHGRIAIGHGSPGVFVGDMDGEQIGGLQLGRHIGQLEADALEAADGLAELLAGRRPLGGDLQRPFGLAAAIRRDQDPGIGQPLAGLLEALALLAQDVAGGDPAVAEGKLVIVVAAVGDRARAAAYLESLGPDIDQEGGDLLAGPARRLADAGDGEQNDEIRRRHAADEMLAAVDDIILAVPDRAGLDAHGVRAGIGLGEGEPLLALAADHREEISLTLVVAAGIQDLRGPADPSDQPPGRFAELAIHQRRRDEVEPAAADLGRHIRGIESHLHGALLDLLAQLERHLALPFDLTLMGKDFLGHELADGLDKHLLLVAGREVEGHRRFSFAASLPRPRAVSRGAENNNLPRAEEACRERPGSGKTPAFRGAYHALWDVQLCDHCSGSGTAV